MRNFKTRLEEGERAFGAIIDVPDPAVIEVIASSHDWLFIDLEHAPIGISQVPDIIRTAELHDTASLVRVPSVNYPRVDAVLDAGADGLIFPHINNKSDARQIRDVTKYPPIGGRSVGYGRASEYGEGVVDMICKGDDRLLNVIQIEDQEAVRNIHEILSVEQVDAVFMGPFDLLVSKDNIENDQIDTSTIAQFDGDVEEVGIEANENDVIFGSPILTADHLRLLKRLGGTLLITGTALDFVSTTSEERLSSLTQMFES